MYIRVTRNNKGQQYFHLVESCRINGKPRQKVLLSLGRVEDNRIEALAKSIAKFTKQVRLVDLAKDVSVDETFILGPLLVLEQLFESLGIKAILDWVSKSHPKSAIDIAKVVFSLVASRLIRPRSKLAVFEHELVKFFPGMIDTDIPLHHLYRVLDLLSQHKDDIEQRLYWHKRDLLNCSVDVVLYDLTTLRFESTREDIGELRRFGYSKEMRSDCTQIILGLLVDEHGLPLGFEVYPGNTFEGHTLSDIVDKIRHKFKVRRFIFVGDRGLFSKQNIIKLKEDGGEFIVGMRLDYAKKHHSDFYDLSHFKWLDDDHAVYDTIFRDDRCIITWSRDRAKRDEKVREDIIKKMCKKLTKNATTKTFVSNHNYRRFIKGLDSSNKPLINYEAIAEAKKHDGFFAILTNVSDKSVQEIASHYRQLWRIEDAFGEIKGTLKARPIFHWNDQRIIGHLTLCFIAYLCEAHITKCLRQHRAVRTGKASKKNIIEERPLSAQEALAELVELRAIPVKIQEETIWLRNEMGPNAKTLFAALHLRPPPRILSNIAEQN
jgi:transposase